MSKMLSHPLSFDRVASEYERTRPLPASIGESIAHYIVNLAGDSWILDAGCGTGRFTRPLAVQSAKVVGADVSSEMLMELRRLQGASPQPVLVTTDLRMLPFLDGQFSTVLAVHVLHLIADWQEALAEMWRVLNTGGHLLLGYEDRSVSAIRDYYMLEGQRRGLLPAHPGARNTQNEILPYIRSTFGAVPTETVSLPGWQWQRSLAVQGMLADLDKRLYSSQWQIPESAHEEIMVATRENMKARFGTIDADTTEVQETRFILHVLKKS